MNRPASAQPYPVQRYQSGSWQRVADPVAVEDPLEIRLEVDAGGVRASQSISVTMRTPGHDFALAAGFLFTEGILRTKDDIAEMTYCLDSKDGEGQQTYNVVTVTLRPWVRVDAARLLRNFYTTSSCGVCGKASLDAVRVQVATPPMGENIRLSPQLICALPQQLQAEQALFHATGGIHASWLCDAEGNLLGSQEDVGRHNALDKLIGAEFLAGRTPLSGRVVVLSGRASFEQVQKAAVAGIPVVVAVGAPSSLAIDLAAAQGMTLLGFTKASGFNAYCGVERLAGVAAVAGRGS